MDKPGCWVIAFIEYGHASLEFFTGTSDYSKAVNIMKKKYGKEGKFLDKLSEIRCTGNTYYTLLWINIDLNIALWVDIDQNQFEVGANIPGLKCKTYYLDSEHSCIKKSKIFKLDDNAVAEMTKTIKEEVNGRNHCNS